jgi:hypothetical protein
MCLSTKLKSSLELSFITGYGASRTPKGEHMKLIAIAIAFVASAAFANQPAATTTTTTTEKTATTTTEATPATTTATAAHGKAMHGKAMKADKKTETAKTAAPGCTKEDEKAGKCKPEATK